MLDRGCYPRNPLRVQPQDITQDPSTLTRVKVREVIITYQTCRLRGGAAWCGHCRGCGGCGWSILNTLSKNLIFKTHITRNKFRTSCETSNRRSLPRLVLVPPDGSGTRYPAVLNKSLTRPYFILLSREELVCSEGDMLTCRRIILSFLPSVTI